MAMVNPLIALDPGHGGLDSGALGINGLKEKGLNWQLANGVQEALAPYVCRVAIIQPSCDNPGSTGRDELVIPPQKALDMGADFYLSIHCDAGGGEGFSSFVYSGAVDSASDNIRRVLHKTVMEYLAGYGVRDRGLKYANFYVLRAVYGKISACLLENLFVDNEKDAALLRDEKFIAGLSNQIAWGLVLGLGLERRK